MSFDLAEKVADAVLFEGYLLYPYRASSQKNQLRWQFGVLMPPAYPDEPSSAQSECLLEAGADTRLHVRLRCLQLQTRTSQPARVWDEGVVRDVDVVVHLRELVTGEHVTPFSLPATREIDGDVVRQTWPALGQLTLSAEPLEYSAPAFRLRLRIENTTPCHGGIPSREEALRGALIAAHTLQVASDGAFISLLDPPDWAAQAAAACVNERMWPVLVGEAGQREVMLSSPIILYDYPRVAPESPADLFDATEIDEILTLRTMALTDDEKREARETDPRAAALVDRADDMPPEILERLHGAIRSIGSPTEKKPAVPWWDPGADASVSPETDALLIAGTTVTKGSRVRLAPGKRRADAQDMFLVGRIAIVDGIFFDVDGERYVAVHLQDDPAADLYQSHGRFLYFHPDEVTPLEKGA
jgi:hypothetical protein